MWVGGRVGGDAGACFVSVTGQVSYQPIPLRCWFRRETGPLLYFILKWYVTFPLFISLSSLSQQSSIIVLHRDLCVDWANLD